jgi:hypothetical protein
VVVAEDKGGRRSSRDAFVMNAEFVGPADEDGLRTAVMVQTAGLLNFGDPVADRQWESVPVTLWRLVLVERSHSEFRGPHKRALTYNWATLAEDMQRLLVIGWESLQRFRGHSCRLTPNRM